MANTAPSTPETPRRMAMNRAFTVPSKLATSSRNAPTVEIGNTKDVETLYVHPNASIVKFSTPSASRPSSSSSNRSQRGAADSAGGLAWTSLTERTMAAGPLEIYRVPGSVSFLHSGALLHAILPRSQCWCVDGISKFALRVLPDTYYRIELPAETPEDLEKVEELKGVLAKVLFFERTACPFSRGFGNELPAAEEIDTRKKARRKSHGPAKRWTLDRAYSWKPEDGGETPRGDGEESEGSAGTASSEDEVESGAERYESREEAREAANKIKVIETPSRPAGLAAMRSITAPPQLTLRSTPPSRIRTSFMVDNPAETTERVTTQTPRLDPARLRTFQPIPTVMPPSPPDSSAGLELAEALPRVESAEEEGQRQRREEQAARREDLAVQESGSLDEHTDANDAGRADRQQTTEPALDGTRDSPRPQSASPPTEPEAEPSLARQRSPEDPFAAIQARILARRSIGGTTSFHPSRSSPPRSSTSTSSTSSSTATLASRDLPRTRAEQQTLASALVKRACSAFLGPPAHLVALMLRIAARFTNGALGFGQSFVVETPRGHKRVPGSFDLRSVDADDFEDETVEEPGLEEWEEDDFGVPLRSPVRLAQMASAGESGGTVRERRRWEVD